MDAMSERALRRSPWFLLVAVARRDSLPGRGRRQTTDSDAHRTDRRHHPRRRRRRSLSLARGRRLARGPALDRPAERADAQDARRVRGAQGAGRAFLAALRDRLAGRAGAAPQGQDAALFLHAPRRQAEPGGALRARRPRWPGPRAGRRQRAGRRRHARAGLVGAVGGRRAGGLRYLRRRQRGIGAARARRRHRARPARRDSRARAPARWPGSPTARGSTTRATRPRAPCRPAKRSTTAASSATAWATIRRATRRSSARAAISRTGRASRCRRTAAGWSVAGRPGLVEERALPARRARAGKAPPPPTTVVDGIDANFDVVELLDDRIYIRSNQDAPRGRLFAADLRHPQRAHWKEILPQRRRDPRERDGAARPDRRALSQGCDVARAALLRRRQAAARAGVAGAGQRRARSAASATATSCSCRSRRS